MLKRIAIAVLHGSGWPAILRRRTRNSLRIVTYHGVDERTDPVLNVDRLQVQPERFERQLATLARAYRVIELGQAVRQWLERGQWPDRGLAITFDDGYRNNLEVAAPILRKLGLPATFFVTSGFVEGRVHPWWYALRQFLAAARHRAMPPAVEAVQLEAKLRPLSETERNRQLTILCGGPVPPCDAYPLMRPEEVARLAALGFDVQPHGDGHLSFWGESPDRLAQEVRDSTAFVRRLTGRTPWGYAYPYGHAPRPLTAADSLLKPAGLSAGLTTQEGWNTPQEHRWALRRWDLHGGYTPAAASLRVAGWRTRRRVGAFA